MDVRWHDGRIEIEPAGTPVDLERRGRFLVAVPQTEIGKLAAETVEETREALREERLSGPANTTISCAVLRSEGWLAAPCMTP